MPRKPREPEPDTKAKPERHPPQALGEPLGDIWDLWGSSAARSPSPTRNRLETARNKWLKSKYSWRLRAAWDRRLSWIGKYRAPSQRLSLRSGSSGLRCSCRLKPIIHPQQALANTEFALISRWLACPIRLKMPDDYTHSMAYAGGPRFPLSSFIFFMKPSVFCIRHSAALSCALQWMASWRLLSFSFFPARRSPFLLSPRRIRLRSTGRF